MNITNRYGLPSAIVEAVKGFDAAYRESHDEPSDISVTELIAPPQQIALRRKHDAEISEDASDRLWALMGQSIHALLAKAEPSALVEQRLYGTYNGWRVSGAFDRMTLREATLQDYKFCSVWEIIYGLRSERETQLNCLAQLAHDNGYANVSRIEVVALLRDWQQSKAAVDPDYPQRPMVRVPVPMWDEARRLEYIGDRVELHRTARDGTAVPCTDDDRWYKGTTYAVMKGTNKKATRVFDTREQADVMAATDGKFNVVERPGEHKRCESYCNVSAFCPQWAAIRGYPMEAK